MAAPSEPPPEPLPESPVARASGRHEAHAGGIGTLSGGNVAQGGWGHTIAQAGPGGTAIGAIEYRWAPPSPVDPTALTKARRLLKRMPLQAVPHPASLPDGSRMRLAPNPLFVGREAELRAMAVALRQDRAVVALTGMGGEGKTQLAVEFVHRYGRYFAGGVFWLSFADADAVAVEVTSCGASMGLRPDFHLLPLEMQALHVLGAWRSALPRLLVFDNCEDEALLRQWRPPSGGARVLVTSRRAHWDATLGVTALPVGLLPRPDSMTLLWAHRFDPCPDGATLHDLADELGDLPLALHLAGKYLGQYRHDTSPRAYLAALRAAGVKHESLDKPVGPSPTNHVPGLRATFDLSLARLDEAQPRDVTARELLARAAYFAASELIPRDWLRASLAQAEPGPASGAAIIRLVELGLLEEEADGSLRIHRLVAEYVREALGTDEAQSAVENLLLAEALRRRESGRVADLAAVQPHLAVAVGRADRRVDMRAALLNSVLGLVLQDAGVYGQAKCLFERALTICEDRLGPNHPDTSACLNNLAGLLQVTGDYAAARPLFERALDISEQQLGPNHPSTGASLNNLATLLHDLGDYAAARPLAERALSISEHQLGPDHPFTGASLNNVANLLRSIGDYAAARPLAERALSISEQQLGPDHRDTAASLNNLASLLKLVGEYVAARPLYERAVAIYEQHLGADHPTTAVGLSNLAGLLQDMGEYAAARPLFERALAIREQQLGPVHPSTAASLNNLAGLLQAADDHAAARPLLERALAINEQRLGPGHPATATSLGNLAMLLRTIGDYAAARPLLERALAIDESANGLDHPSTAVDLNCLALLLQDVRDYASARVLFERALAINAQQLGSDHPTTATSLNNLAVLLRDIGEYDIARSRFERALAIHEMRLGPNHPDTATSMNNLGMALCDLGKNSAARPLFERALAIYQRALGEEHPTTVAAGRHLQSLQE